MNAAMPPADRLDPANLAAELNPAERAVLLAMPVDEWAKAPAFAETQSLLFDHGIPLIAANGDWVRTTRIGSRVQRELQSEGSPA